VHQVHERLLHLFSQLTRGAPLESLSYWLVQCVTPLLQTQAEALEARPFFSTRLLQNVFDTGDLDVYIAYFT
jgi:predicted glycosyl hydrolase (DUF1957 family)